jgi:hypothetical protein
LFCWFACDIWTSVALYHLVVFFFMSCGVSLASRWPTAATSHTEAFYVPVNSAVSSLWLITTQFASYFNIECQQAHSPETRTMVVVCNSRTTTITIKTGSFSLLNAILSWGVASVSIFVREIRFTKSRSTPTRPRPVAEPLVRT